MGSRDPVFKPFSTVFAARICGRCPERAGWAVDNNVGVKELNSPGNRHAPGPGKGVR
jgi:hypothetical protein